MKYLGFTVLNSWACEPASLLALASWAPMSAAEDTWPFQTVLMDKQQALLYSFPVSGLHLLVIKLSSCLYDHGQVTNPFWAPMLPIFKMHNSGSLSISHHSKNLWLRVLPKLCGKTWPEPTRGSVLQLSLSDIIMRFTAEILMFDYHGHPSSLGILGRIQYMYTISFLISECLWILKIFWLQEFHWRDYHPIN